MTACIIVMNWDGGNELPGAALLPQKEIGLLYASCNPCDHNLRIFFNGGIAGTPIVKTTSGAAGDKPTETYVIGFVDLDSALAWEDAWAPYLVNKMVFRLNPAVTYPPDGS